MTDNPATLALESSHTEEMVREELAVMSGGNILASKVTAQALLKLAFCKSPLLFGGIMTKDDIRAARKIIGVTASAEELRLAINTAFRPLEIIEPCDETHTQLTSSYETFSPEWFSDIYAALARVSPSTTWAQYLAEIPWCTVCHLVAAAHRAAGGITARPVDMKAALDRINQDLEKGFADNIQGKKPDKLSNDDKW